MQQHLDREQVDEHISPPHAWGQLVQSPEVEFSGCCEAATERQLSRALLHFEMNLLPHFTGRPWNWWLPAASDL